MDQKQLCVAAKQRQGLTSDGKLAQALGVDRSRASKLVRGVSPADEAEIMMLADMAGIDAHIAFAAVHKDREKNPAKRAYWEKISMRFAMAMMAGCLVFTGFASDAKAASPIGDSINYAKFAVRKYRAFRRFNSLMCALMYRLAQARSFVNA